MSSVLTTLDNDVPPATDAASALARSRVPLRPGWPALATLVTVVAGMLYSLLVHRVGAHGLSYWTVPGDIWSEYRSAHYIGWGDFGGVYAAGTGLVTFPGVLFLLAPVAMMTGALGLTESFPYPVPHPTAWLVLGPYEILLSSTALFACDALAERIGVSRRRRFWLCAVEAVALWNVDVVWGHPEDALATALAVFALLSALDDRWRRCGWLFGAAVLTQPLVVLVLPVLVAVGGRRKIAPLALRSVVPTIVLMVLPLVEHFHDTAHAILDQPNFPVVDHVTPWTALAPSLGGRGAGAAVAAGPGRVLAVLLACGLGAYATRWRSRPEMIVVAFACALALRCLTESVMVSFYLWPPLAIGLVASARTGPKHLAFASVVAVGVTVFSDYKPGPWWFWWGIVTLGLLAVIATSLPLANRRAGKSSKNPSSSGSEMPEPIPKMVPC